MGAAESFLTMVGVRQRVGLSASMIYRLVSHGQFPKPAKFGTRSLWVASEVDAWIADRIKAHNMGRNMGENLAV